MKKNKALYILAIIGITYIIGTTLVFIFFNEHPFILFGKIDMEAFADFGSHIGGVATFFAFLFAFVIFHEQAKTTRIQQFETTFFNMLSHFDSIINSIIISETGRLIPGELIENNVKEKIGKQALNTLFEDFMKVINSQSITMDELWNEEFKSNDTIYNRWQEIYKANISTLPQYFRYYYTLVKFIMTNEDISDKKRYTDILQAKMSSHEMGLIFYNTFYNPSISKQVGAKRFIEWLNNKEIGLFENIQKESVIDIKDFKEKCNINYKHI